MDFIFILLLIFIFGMKSCRLPKKEFDLIRANRKSEMSCHKKKHGEKQYLAGSRDEHGSIVCGCCKHIFFSRDEYAQLIRAEKKLKSINDELERLDDENRKKIDSIYCSSSISILDMYVPNPEIDQTIVFAERTNIDKQISDAINAKNLLQTQLKQSICYTEEDDKLITRMYNIETKCVVNCCYDCHFRWYCEKCCFTFKAGKRKTQTCGITLMTRLLNINNHGGRYGMLTDSDIYLLQNRFQNDMKYGIHPDCLRGKVVDIDELRDEQKKKIRKIENVLAT